MDLFNEYQQIPFKLNELETFKKVFNPNKPLFLDTETGALYKNIKLVQIYQEGLEHVYLFKTDDIKLADIYETIKNCYVLVFNYPFDSACFMHDLQLDYNPFNNFECLLLLSKLAFFNKLESFSLDSCLNYVLGFDPYKKHGIIKQEAQVSFTKLNNYSIPHELLLYSAIDVFYMGELFKVVKNEIHSEPYKLDKAFIKNSIVWQRNGLPILQNQLKDYKEKINKEIRNNIYKLPDININSSIQVKKLLGTINADELTLKRLERLGNKNAKLILETKKLMKIDSFLDSYNFNYIYGYFSTLTKSGRVKCNGSNLPDGSNNIMQIPRNLNFLIGFNPNEKSQYKFIIHADYSQLELRSITALAGEFEMYKIFKNNEDLHTKTAAYIFNKSTDAISKAERYLGKVCNFSLLYGAGFNTFKNIIEKDSDIDFKVPNDKEIIEIIKKWKSLYNNISKWQNEAKEAIEAGNFINKTLNGKYYKADKFTEYLSVANQGLGAEIAKLALHYFILQNGNDFIMNFVHDAYYLRAENIEQAESIGKSIADCMVMAFFDSIKNAKIKDVPIPVNVEIAYNLKDIETNPLKTIEIKGDYDYYLKLKNLS